MTTPKKLATPRKKPSIKESLTTAAPRKKVTTVPVQPGTPAPAKRAAKATAKPTAKPATGTASTKPAPKRAAAKEPKPKKPVSQKGTRANPKPRPVSEARATKVAELEDFDALTPEEEVIQERFRRAVEIVNASDLQPRIKMFVVEYAKDLNGKNAAIRAEYSPHSAQEQASRLLSSAKVKNVVDQIMNDRIEQGIFDGDAIVARWMDISTANPNALTQYRRCNCRYCWGADHGYQRTPREFRMHEDDHLRDVTAALKENKPPPRFDPQGGKGFWGTKDPNPECPECFGEGEGVPFFTDSRKLDRQSLTLYAGVKQTKDGLEIQMHDQAAATDKLARHFGLYKDKLADALAGSYTAESLEARFGEAMAIAQRRQKELAEDRANSGVNGEAEDKAT